jgi:P27 family predicted phage terminase small subunit
VLSALDLDLFASYAVTVAAVEELTQRLNRADLVVVNARGKLSANPLFRMCENAVATMRALAVELGITPSARARLHLAPPQARDPFEALLEGEDDVDEDKVVH